MQFSISSAELKEQLQIVSGAIGSNPVLPILEDFLFRVKENSLEISATDLETFMTSELEISATGEGNIAIPSKILVDTLKKLPTQPITFDIDLETFAVSITSAFGQYQLAGEDGNDFPKIPVPKEVDSIQIPSILLMEGINKTLFATSNDELRPAMTGVLVELTDEGINFVATDAHKLVKYTFTEVKCGVETSFIVPRKALSVLKNALANSAGTVEIAFNKSNAFFTFGNEVMVCRLIDARYPNYNAVIPKDNTNVMTIVRGDLLNSIKRLSSYANKTTNQIKLIVESESLTIEAEDIDFSNKAKEQIPCYYNGDHQIVIGFNAKFLIDILNAMDADNVRLELAAANRAGILRYDEENEGEELLMLVMPVMLNV